MGEPFAVSDEVFAAVETAEGWVATFLVVGDGRGARTCAVAKAGVAVWTRICATGLVGAGRDKSQNAPIPMTTSNKNPTPAPIIQSEMFCCAFCGTTFAGRASGTLLGVGARF